MDKDKMSFDLVKFLNSATGSYWFQDELDTVKAAVYSVDYPEMTFRDLFPISTEADPADETVSYYVYDIRGMSKIIGEGVYDLPSVAVGSKKVTAYIKTVGCSFPITKKDIQRSQKTGRNLATDLAKAADESQERKFNDMAFNGDADYGIVGVFTHPNIPTGNVPNGVSGFPDWPQKTPDEILDDVNSMYLETRNDTAGIEKPDTLALPPSRRDLIMTKRLTGESKTILTYLLEEIEWLSGPDSIKEVPELETSGAGGIKEMFSYRKDPRVVEYEIAQESEMGDGVPHALHVEVPMTGEVAGLQIKKPLAFRIKSGI
jgi:hypothetical protein